MLVPKKAECFIVLPCVHRQDLNGYSCTVVLAADRRCQQSESSAGFFVRQFGAKTGTRNGDSYFMERTIFRVPIALSDSSLRLRLTLILLLVFRGFVMTDRAACRRA
jgi:hypothetical protein